MARVALEGYKPSAARAAAEETDLRSAMDDSRASAASAGETPFAAYLAQARAGRPGLWRVLATLLLIILIETAAFLLFAALAGATSDGGLAALENGRVGLIVTLASLAVAPLALAIATPLLHGRSFSSLLSAQGRLEGAQIAAGAVTAAALAVVGLGLGWGLGLATVAWIPGYEAPWLLLAAALVLIVPQAAGEELLFRGYLLQEFGARIPHPLFWAALPSALFAALHFGPDASAEALAYAASTFLFGLFAAALVWRMAGLSAAIGFHVMNNWIAIGLFEPPQGVDGLGPFAVRFVEGGAMTSLALDMALLGAAYLLLARLTGRAARP